jgi:hypothetical protein
MSKQNGRSSKIKIENSQSSTKVFPLVDLTSENETTGIESVKRSPTHEPANMTLHNNHLEKRKCVIEIGKSEVVLKLNQKILECIERDDRDKADEYKECLKECLSSFSQSERHRSDTLPVLVTSINQTSSSISNEHTSTLETPIPAQEEINLGSVDNMATVTEAQDHSSKKWTRWTSREEWMLVAGEVRVVASKGNAQFDQIKAMFKPELDRFTNTALRKKLYILKNHNPYIYNTLVKQKKFEGFC